MKTDANSSLKRLQSFYVESAMALLRFVKLLAAVVLLSMLGQVAECKECDKPADIVFILDASSTIHPTNFTKMQEFVASIIRNLPVGPSMIRCGVVTYSTNVNAEFGLRKYSTAQKASEVVLRMTQSAGNTRTDLALNRMRQMMAEDKRPGVPQIAIVLTDGDSDKAALTKTEAELAHKEGIIVFALGIGVTVHPAELNVIASRKDYAYSFDDFEGLASIRGILEDKACQMEEHNDQPNPTPQECPDKLADVMFVVDESQSIIDVDFTRQKKFLQDMVALFQVSKTGTHVGLITFGDKVVSWFGLDRYYTVPEVQSAIKRIIQKNGLTYTADALRYVREISFTKTRAGAMKIAVVITDGSSTNRQSTAKEAAQLKEAGVTVFAIGVGSGVKKTELHAIASSPLDKHVFMVNSYKALESIKHELISNACLSEANDQEQEQSIVKGQRPWNKNLRMLQLLSEKD